MYYPTKQEEIIEQLNIRAIDLYNQEKAISHLINALTTFKRKNLDKYFIDHLKNTSPTYIQNYTEYNSQTRQDEPKSQILPLYTASIQKDYFCKLNLYINPTEKIDFYLPSRVETFTFYNNDKEPFTPQALLEKANARLENIISTTNKLNNDRINITTIKAEYDQAMQKLEKVKESMHFYTLDFISGKNSYRVGKFSRD